MTSARRLSRVGHGGGHRSSLDDALANLIDIGYVSRQATASKYDYPEATKPEVEFDSGKSKWSNAVEATGRVRTSSLCRCVGLYCVEQAMKEVLGPYADVHAIQGAGGGDCCGFHEAVRRAVASPVIRDRKIANYHPYPPTHGTPVRVICMARPGLTGRSAEHSHLRGERPGNFKGIDIMRPCAVLTRACLWSAHAHGQRKNSQENAHTDGIAPLANK